MIIIMLIKAISQRDIRKKELGSIVKNLEPWIINNNGEWWNVVSRNSWLNYTQYSVRN